MAILKAMLVQLLRVEAQLQYDKIEKEGNHMANLLASAATRIVVLEQQLRSKKHTKRRK